VRLRSALVVLLLAGTATIPASAAPGVYSPGPHTLFYLPLDGPDAGAPEGCGILNPALLSYIPDRLNNPASAIHVSATASPSDSFYISCSNTKIAANPDPNQSLTVGYWTRMTQVPTLGGPRNFTILATNSDNGGCRKYVVTGIENGGFPFGCQGGTNGNTGQFISTTPVADGNWHNLLFVFDHANKVVTLYIDGIPNGTAALLDPSYTASNSQFIAGAENGSFALNGDLDDFWVEDHAWSTAEIGAFFGSSTSGAPSSSFGLCGSPICPSASTSEPINTATGNYYTSRSDLVVPSKGLAFNFNRFYNSLDSYIGPLGAGWTHSFNVFLTVNAANANVKEADGHQVTFTPTGGGNYSPATAGLFDTLSQNGDGTFTLTRKNQTRFNFSPAGKLTSVVDRNGNTQTLSYDGSGNLISVLDSSARVFTLTNDGAGRITSLSDPTGRTWRYAYDANGNLQSITDAVGGVTQYAYDANHRMISATDPRGVTYLQNVYDSVGRVASQTNARAFTTTLSYNTPSAGTTSFTDPLGNTTQHVYDGALRLVSVVNASGGTTTYTYDANNNRTSVTNQNVKKTSFTYDAQGNTTSITDPLGNSTTFSYDSKNNLLAATSAKGNSTTLAYDAKGNLATIQNAIGNTTSFSYDPAGLLLSKTDARGNSTAFSYDANGSLVHITDPIGNQISLSYDVISRLVSTTDANAHTASASYDALGRLVKIADPLGNQTQFAYDSVGNLSKLTDAKGNATSYAYDPTNNLVTVTDALSHLTAYAYDANNDRIGFTNAKGNATAYTYDALNRLTQITDPLSLVTSYVYDAVGNVLSTTDANGKTNQFSYDALNRLTNIAYAAGNTVAYSYDPDGNRTSMAD